MNRQAQCVQCASGSDLRHEEQEAGWEGLSCWGGRSGKVWGGAAPWAKS